MSCHSVILNYANFIYEKVGAKNIRTIYHEQFWSRIRRTAAESCEVLLHLFQSLGKAEVTKKHVILACEEHILCLDIPEDKVYTASCDTSPTHL